MTCHLHSRKIEKTVKKHVDIVLTLKSGKEQNWVNHLIAPQQNNRKWQVFLIIASLGGEDRDHIVLADVPVASNSSC